MGKSERKQAESLARQNLSQEQQQAQQFVSQRESERQQARSRSDALYGDVTEGWKSLASTGGYSPEDLGVAKETVAASGLDKSSAYDPEQLARLRETSNINIVTGGYDMPQLAKVRGGYESLMSTGGISDEEAASMGRTASRGVRSVYDVLGEEANRRRAATGGYGGSGETAMMARQAAQKQAETLTDVGTKVAGLRQTGRIEGTKGLAGTEESFAGARRGALATSAGIESDVARDTTSRQTASANLLAQIQSDIASGRKAGVAGLTTTYGLSLQEAQDLGNQILQRIQMGQQASQADLAILAELSKQGILSSITGLVGAGAGALSSLFGAGNKKD